MEPGVDCRQWARAAHFAMVVAVSVCFVCGVSKKEIIFVAQLLGNEYRGLYQVHTQY